MWRCTVDADWERRKAHLIRNLFQETPLLSPIQEEESDNVTQSPVNVPPPPVPEEYYTPPSPLPPLIIEREPNRHDEPEEYYIQFEKRIMKIYRKLFNEGYDLDSNLSDDTEGTMDRTIDDDFNDLQYNIKAPEEKDSPSSKRTHPLESDPSSSESHKSKKAKVDEDSSDLPKSTPDESNKSPRESFSLSTTTEPNETAGNGVINEEAQTDTSESQQGFLQVTFQAEVHREEAGVPSPSATYVLDVDENAAVERDALAIDDREPSEILEEAMAVECDVGIPENNEGSDINHSQHSSVEPEEIQEIEVMRATRIQSIGSIHNEGFDETNRSDTIEKEPQLQQAQAESISSVARDSLEINFDENRDSYGSDHDTSTFTDGDKPECGDAGAQTDFDAQNRDIFINAFVGNPRVYRLCNCFNHRCEN